MIQVWMIDDDGFYLDETKFVNKLESNMTTVPLLVGYIKPRLVNNSWTEGATDEEIAAWKKENNYSVPYTKTTEERLEELEAKAAEIQEAIAELYIEGATEGSDE